MFGTDSVELAVVAAFCSCIIPLHTQQCEVVGGNQGLVCGNLPGLVLFFILLPRVFGLPGLLRMGIKD